MEIRNPRDYIDNIYGDLREKQVEVEWYQVVEEVFRMCSIVNRFGKVDDFLRTRMNVSKPYGGMTLSTNLCEKELKNPLNYLTDSEIVEISKFSKDFALFITRYPVRRFQTMSSIFGDFRREKDAQKRQLEIDTCVAEIIMANNKIN